MSGGHFSLHHQGVTFWKMGQLRLATNEPSMRNIHEGELQVPEPCPVVVEAQSFVECLDESRLRRKVLVPEAIQSGTQQNQG